MPRCPRSDQEDLVLSQLTKKKIESFDVFETVLLRVVGQPESLFLFVGKAAVRQGILPCSPAVYKDIRIEAECEAYRRYGYPTLDNIFEAIPSLLALKTHELDWLKEEELRLEKNWSRMNPRYESRLASARNLHGRTLFISDMYLPKKFIEDNLRDKNILTISDTLYVSNQVQAGKGDGSLYSEVLKKQNLVASALTHHGNCPQSDVKAPRKLGIRIIPYSEGNLSNWECFLETYSDSTDGLASLWAGASRRARCSLPEEMMNHMLRTIRDTAVSVAGPLLTNFVHWSLRRAVQDGISSLAFVARDGQILIKIAELLQKSNPEFQKLELRYIYGSRQAWRPAAIEELGNFEKSWILEGEKNLTPEKILSRVNLGLEYLDQLPATNDLDDLWNKLCCELRNQILKASSMQRGLVVAYLEQENLLGNMNLGIVEIGCTGTTLSALGRIMQSVNSVEPRTYFFGLSNANHPYRPPRPTTYFYDEKSDQGISPSSDFNYFVLLEMFCAATHGRTTGYQRNRGKVEPVLEPTQKYWQNPRSTDFLQQGILAFAEAYADSPLMEIDPTTAIPLVAKVIRKFWQKPNQEEAEVWGSYCKEHDQSGFGAPAMGRVYTVSDLAHCVRNQGLPETWWPAATRIRTPQTTMKLLETGTYVGKGLAQARIRLGGLKRRLMRKG